MAMVRAWKFAAIWILLCSDGMTNKFIMPKAEKHESRKFEVLKRSRKKLFQHTQLGNSDFFEKLKGVGG